jgi:hypothetical protein
VPGGEVRGQIVFSGNQGVFVLSGASSVPATNSIETGTAICAFVENGRSLSYSVTVSAGLVGMVTAAHFHVCLICDLGAGGGEGLFLFCLKKFGKGHASYLIN